MADFNAEDINAVLNAVNDGDISDDEPSTTRPRRRKIEDSVAESDLNVFANADRKIAPGDMSDNDADTEEEPQSRIQRRGRYRKRRSKYQKSPNSASTSASSSGYSTDDSGGSYNGDSGASSPANMSDMPDMHMNTMPSPKRLSHSERLRLKAQLLARLERKQRFSGQAFEIPKDATLKELQLLDYKISYESRAAAAVKNYQRILIFVVGLWEGTCKRYPWIGLDLQDYSEQVFLTIDQFDEDLYELYDMYGAKRVGHPLLRIIMTILTGSVAYSMTRKMMAARNNPQYGTMGGTTQEHQYTAPQAAQQASQAKPTMATSVDDLMSRVESVYGSGPAAYNSNMNKTGRYGPGADIRMDLPSIPEDDDDDEFGDMPGPPANMIQMLRQEEDDIQEKRGKRMPVDAVVSEMVQDEGLNDRDDSPPPPMEPRTVPQSTKQRRKRGAGGVVPQKMDTDFVINLE